MLCCFFNLANSYAAYQEMEDDGWSEFNSQMQTAARNSQHKMATQAAIKPHAPPSYKAPKPKLIERHPLLPPPYSFVGSISAGPVWESAGQTQTLNLTPTIKKTYSADNQSNLLYNGELFAGIQRILTPNFQGQLGVAIAMSNSGELSGNIWDDALSEFDNYTYSYNVQHSHIALKGRLLTDTNCYALKPYVSASFGIGFNKAENFTNVPIIYEAVKTPDFTATTTTSFTYTLGLGVQRALNTNVYLGLGYEFASWGNSRLGAAAEQTIGEGLALDQLYTNALMLHLTFIG